MRASKVAVVQAGSVPFDADATTAKALTLLEEAAGNGASLVLFPEAFIGTYPKGLTFGSPVGRRTDEGRDEYLRYVRGAVTLDGPEVAAVVGAAAEHGVFVVMGVVERLGSTLYCTALLVDPVEGLVGHHRKVMPTGSERLVWGFGDGSTLPVVQSDAGAVGAVICWENYMPLMRAAMYAQGVELYCAPTADDRDTWQASVQHIALEGRCYVLSACQYITRGAFGDDYPGIIGEQPDDVLMRGGSVVVSPLGEVLAGPVFDREETLYAEVSPDDLTRSKLDFDPVGHYARPEVFGLTVDTRSKAPVEFLRDDPEPS
ncbi:MULTISPECIES: carbon-nitrogen hydrolase family protein [unclassified Serinicoccus]|uniref:carbon-nitrogen hydrolase family protein n=1 Tax=unclassified Serinicoccus TaxID=2643101 RepID=UPI003854223D